MNECDGWKQQIIGAFGKLFGGRGRGSVAVPDAKPWRGEVATGDVDIRGTTLEDAPVARVTFEGLTPFSPTGRASRHPLYAATLEAAGVDPDDPDNHEAREAAVWRLRCQTNAEGRVIVPPMVMRGALADAARYLGERMPGPGRRLWVDVITQGTFVDGPAVLSVRPEDAEYKRVLVRTRPGNGFAVRFVPQFREWGGSFDLRILDPRLPFDVFERIVDAAGRFVGVGRWTPERGGINGRFLPAGIEWPEALPRSLEQAAKQA